MSGSGPIIIVEDDLDDQDSLREILQMLNLKNEVKFFKEGSVVIDYLRTTEEKPFLILTDVNLPGMNGIQLREEILKEEYLRKKSIPFIFLSTSDGKFIIQKVYELQVQGYFQKQQSFEAMKKQLQAIVTYWQMCRHPNN